MDKIQAGAPMSNAGPSSPTRVKSDLNDKETDPKAL